MNITWDNIYLAIQLVVAVQLILGITLNVFEFKQRNILLAYLCFLIVYSYSAFLLYPFKINTYIHKIIHSFGSYIYFGPILYLYLRSLVFNTFLKNKEIAKHLTFPFIACIIFNTIGYSFYHLIIYGFLISYLILSILLYKKIKKQLHGALKKRFQWFFVITMVYLLVDTPMLIIEDLALLGVYPFKNIFPSVNIFFYTYLHFPLLFFHFFILSLYAITEISRFKKFFLSKSLKEIGFSDKKMSALKNDFERIFEVDKIYLDQNLSLDILSKKLLLDKSAISKFTKETYNKGLMEYINQHRVEEFKRILFEKKHLNYDLVGLAKESGFNSKATFFRVFKNLEGITPNEYRKNVDRN